MKRWNRNGSGNSLYILAGAALAILAILSIVLINMGRPRAPKPVVHSGSTTGQTQTNSADLFLYCAAGIRPPIEQIVADYEREYGVTVQVMYGGSNTLLSQIEVAKIGDLYLAADESYTKLAQERGLVKETIPLGYMRPVIVVKKGNAKKIRGVNDLLEADIKCAVGNPDQAAIGRATRDLLQASGQWAKIEQHVTKSGVFFPTVPEVANAVKLGSVDAGIIWDSTAFQYPELEAIHTPELDAGKVQITLGVLTTTPNPPSTLRFARYVGASDKGLKAFEAEGFAKVEGDKWSEVPELIFYCGSVNRRAVADVIKAFEEREGVRVNTVYNGCGILTAQMRTITSQQQGLGFPDTYMACDVYYLNTVRDMFQEDVNISDTEVVITVPKGNPGGIKTLKDLTKPGLRISVGQPDQCTIGALTRQLLQKEGLYDAMMKNVVTEAATSAMLVPTVITKSVDASLAYATDTMAESDKVDSIRIPSEAAKAIQPFAIARSSGQKNLGRRLYQAVAAARDKFEAAGFHFRLNDAYVKKAATE